MILVSFTMSDEGTIPSVNYKFNWKLCQSIELDEWAAVEIKLSPNSSFLYSFNIELTLGSITYRYTFLRY